MKAKSMFQTVKEEMVKELAIPLTKHEQAEADAMIEAETVKAQKLDAEIATLKAEMGIVYEAAFQSNDWTDYDAMDGRLDALKIQRKALVF